jgi:hypothetical protein
LITRQYILDNSDYYYFKLAVFIGGLIHYDVMLIAAIAGGQNVSYMLYPPRVTPVKGKWFRFFHSSFLIVMGWLSGYLIPVTITRLQKWIEDTYKKARANKIK